jgi:hypothetical protein
MKNGMGTFTDSEGFVYKGHYVNDKKEGLGKLEM